jgi:hypothetical protein
VWTVGQRIVEGRTAVSVVCQMNTCVDGGTEDSRRKDCGECGVPDAGDTVSVFQGEFVTLCMLVTMSVGLRSASGMLLILVYPWEVKERLTLSLSTPSRVTMEVHLHRLLAWLLDEAEY